MMSVGLKEHQEIVSAVLKHHPRVQAIYLFGTYGTSAQRADSDLDLALLLEPAEARREKDLAFGACRDALEALTGRSVDPVNLRETNTVFQNEIITEGRLIASPNGPATDAFEMKVMSAYQKLNEERSGILEDIAATGRVLK
jgi:predicted nucleotidyltransferase